MTPPPVRAPAGPGPSVAHHGAVVRFAADLARHGTRIALVDGDMEVTYADLAHRVESERAALGTQQQLVALRPEATTAFVVAYLAALAGGHAVLLSRHDELAAAYGASATRAAGGFRRTGSAAPDLHPDLRLLLSTSGSTGSPKLVRLSAGNLDANAAAIVDYLGIRPDDRALLTLPLDYCYGLSVLHSHLRAGASVVLADGSVSDPALWERARAAGVTSFAGVPYTFELLERSGWPDLPTLRYVTQAGGRMAPERVRELAAQGRREGWQLFVMYGQTEATARIAYLPPHLAEEHAGAIGVAIPGGRLRLEPVDGASDGIGELVYSGPNVMMGYAHSRADLARGHDLKELRTGDLARRHPAGLFEVVGRRSRFAKLFGQRIDLDRVEALLAVEGHQVACAEAADHHLVVAVATTTDGVAPGDPAEAALRATGLPRHALRVVLVRTLPRLANGKPDHAAVARLEPPTGSDTTGASRLAAVAAEYAVVLGRSPAEIGPDDTFTGLGGDSLSYVELSVRLEARLRRLPRDWPDRTVAELARHVVLGARRPAWVRLDTTILLRAVAIVLIVGSHTNLFVVLGGAHVLLAVAGANFARFLLGRSDPAERRRGVLRAVARIAVPTVIWTAAVSVIAGTYGWRNVLLLNDVLGSRTWQEPQWHYWFIEVLLYLVAGLGLLCSLPRLLAWERRAPYGFPVALLIAALVPRFWATASGYDGDVIHSSTFVGWLFLGGWAAARARTLAERALVTALVVSGVAGFCSDPARELVIGAGLVVLVWVPAVPWPRLAAGAVGVLASSSLYVYLTHWQVYPHLEHRWPLGGLAASLLVGIVAWLAVDHAPSLARRLRRRTSRVVHPLTVIKEAA